MDVIPDSEKPIVVYSTTWCPDCKRVKKFLGEQRVPYRNIDIENDPQSMAFVEQINDGKRIIPTMVFSDGSTLVEPSNAELAEKLGINTTAQRQFYDTIIIGSGPTGLTAGLYMGREGLDALVIEKGGIGGQAAITQTLDNFPGFDQGISGSEFADRLGRQANRFGVEILQANEVVSVFPQGNYWCAITRDGIEYGCRAMLLASGARYRKMGIPDEDNLIGSCVHFCATCDGAFYKGKKVLVVGGGNSGFEEALFLTKFASQVDIVEYQAEVKASQILQDKVAGMPNMRVTVNHAVREIRGEHHIEAIIVEDLTTGKLHEWDYDGVFVFIGMMPNNDLVLDQAELNRHGFIVTDKTLMTSRPGLFATGDVRAGSTKQAASAAGEGATAALMMREYLNEVG
jgi:thioredoxin reductase (NADPH)